MKTKCKILTIGAGTLLAITLLAAPVPVRFAWDYEFTGTIPDYTLYFHFVGSDDVGLAMNQWTHLKVIPAFTNGVLQTNVLLNVDQKQYFFRMYASNMWNVSLYSNITNTPPLPVAPSAKQIKPPTGG